MRTVEAHLMDDKMEEAVTYYINSHQSGEPVHVDTSGLSMNVQDETGRVVTVMQGQGFSSQLSRQVSVAEQVEGGSWNEELLDPEIRLAALVAHLAHQPRTSHHQIPSHHKVSSVRGDVDPSVILDNAHLRLYNGPSLDNHHESIVVEVPSLPPLPPLQEMKRCEDNSWFHNKDKNALKANGDILTSDSNLIDVDLNTGASPAHNKQQNKKSLPHKKRISRKLKRNTGGSTPQQDIVLINCADEVQQEEILPDSFGGGVQHTEHLAEDTHHMTQEVRPILICQLCGEFYGEDQLKFYQHLKQHYEPQQATIIIENPVSELAIDKMTNTCIVDNSATLPDSIVELSLENSVAKTIYQHNIDKQHILYTTSDKSLYTSKLQYSTASIEKEPVVSAADTDKTDLYDTLDKLGTFNCNKCEKYFRKQKNYEAHVKEAHPSPCNKLEDMSEFSEPEDLMEGIHVAVEEGSEQYDGTILPHLTVENGQVHQEHVRHWYMRGECGECEVCGCGACPMYAAAPPPPPPPPPPLAPAPIPAAPVAPPPPLAAAPRHHAAAAADAAAQLKEEVLQRIFESEVAPDQNFSANMTQENGLPPEPVTPHEEPQETTEPNMVVDLQKNLKKGKNKNYICPQCQRVFNHRNSLLYHLLSHGVRQHICKECSKGFYTSTALKVHKRVHSNVRPYKCEVCSRDFRQWSDLKNHKMSIHSDQRQFKCEYCDKDFARKYSLNVHRRVHTGEKNYKCDYCPKSFRTSSYKLSHMRTHTGVKPFKCPICEKCFRIAADMRRHKQIHEKVRNRFEETKKPKEDKPEEEPTKSEVKVEVKNEKPESKIKKVAVASTARPPVTKPVEKKQKPNKKSTIKKEGAPNVTVAKTKTNEQYKSGTYASNIVFETKQEFSKEVFLEPASEFTKTTSATYKNKEYSDQIINYKDDEERELAILRPIFRDSVCDQPPKPVFVNRSANSDGKMQVFTHVEKVSPIMSMGDIRGFDRDRPDLHGEGIENGFLENLTALYNIPAV